MPIINRCGGGGSGVKLNLFAQPDEPATKAGLWVKTPTKQTVKTVMAKSSFVLGGTWSGSGTVGDIPNISSSVVAAVSKGQYIYYVDYAGGVTRYDTVTKTYTHQANTVSGWDSNQSLSYVYNDQIRIYKPQAGKIFTINESTLILSDTGLTAPTIAASGSPNYEYFGMLGMYNGAIYFCYSYLIYESDYMNHWIVYAISQSTLTMSTAFSTSKSASSGAEAYSSGAIVDKYLYCFFSRYSAGYPDTSTTTMNIINLTNGTSTTKTAPKGIMAYGFRMDLGVYQDQLFFMNTMANPIQVYTISTGTFSTIAAMPTQSGRFQYCLALITVGQKMYACDLLYCKVDVFNFTSEALSAGTLAILDGVQYNTKLVTTAAINFLRMTFRDVWWYDTGFQEYPTYIGDGTSWTKIKN